MARPKKAEGAWSNDFIAGLQARPTRYELKDPVLPGLRICVHPSGKKSFVFRYSHLGDYRKLTLGSWPQIKLVEAVADRNERLARDPKSAAPDARSLARAALADKATGVDPAEKKQEHKRKADGELGPESLVEDVWLDYAKNHLDDPIKVSASSAERFKGIYTNHVSAKLADRQIGKVIWRNISEAIEAAKAAGPYAANSVFTVMSAFFNWTVAQDFLNESPMKGKTKPYSDDELGDESDDDDFLPDDQIKTFWDGCDKLESLFTPMFQFLLVTGQRRTEVASMEWREVDFESRYFTISAERSKNGKAHKVYLCDLAIAILKSVPCVEGCKFIFSTTGDTPMSGFSKAKDRFDKLNPEFIARRESLGLPEWHIHTLRKTFISGLAALEISETVSERCINHSKGSSKKNSKLRKIYDKHDYAPQMKRAWEAWGAHVERLLAGNVAVNVVALRQPEAIA